MPRGAIFSLGGSPEPVIEALKRRPVECALFLVSEKSEPQVEQTVLPAIGYTLQWECVRTTDPDDLNTCYQKFRHALQAWMDRRGLSPEEIYFDLTGGTKPMSAALTLAAVERIPTYHYVSGERGKDGLGTVITGTEQSVTGPNPWMRIAIRQRELATRFYEQGHLEAAAELLEQAAQIASDKSETLKSFAGLCHVLAKLDLFKFQGLSNELSRLQPRLEITFEHRGDRQLVVWLRGLRAHLQELDSERSRQQDYPRSLLELLANARRRRQQDRYDDAVARLYRAVELFAQNRLYRAFGAKSGRIYLDTLDENLSATLRAAFPDDLIEGNRLQLGCAKAFAALRYSPLEDNHRFPEIYEHLKADLGKRNQSWLAHGTRPATAGDFDGMWDLIRKEFAIGDDSIPNWPQLSFTD